MTRVFMLVFVICLLAMASSAFAFDFQARQDELSNQVQVIDRLIVQRQQEIERLVQQKFEHIGRIKEIQEILTREEKVEKVEVVEEEKEAE